MSTVEGVRHVIVPGEGACLACLQSQVAKTDAFFFRTGNALEAVSKIRQNPFLNHAIRHVQACGFTDGLSINRVDLSTLHARSTCWHVTDRLGSGAAPVGEYRARTLSSFFDVVPEESFVSPVHATVGVDITFDLGGLSTAKSSGFLTEYRGPDSFTKPWGGHTDSFADATRLGILEGIERAACEHAAEGQVFSEYPAGVPALGLGAFGLDRGPWRLPSPTVAAWVLGRHLELPADHSVSMLGGQVALPERLVFYNPTYDRTPWVQDSSNGCAIGGTAEEAILFGILEAIERDAFLASWYAGLDLDPIDPESITNHSSLDYIRRIELAGASVVFLNATVGVEVPTVIAICEEPGGSTCVGAGCHPDPERALKSALIEVASDFQVAAGRREQRTDLGAMLADFSLVRVMEDHADLFVHPDARPLISHWRYPRKPHVSLTSLAGQGSSRGTSVAADLRWTIMQCRKAGFRPVACDVTDGLARLVGAHVWKVVVPGLIPIDFGQYQRVYSMSRLEQIATAAGQPEHGQFTPVRTPHPFP